MASRKLANRRKFFQVIHRAKPLRFPTFPQVKFCTRRNCAPLFCSVMDRLDPAVSDGRLPCEKPTRAQGNQDPKGFPIGSEPWARADDRGRSREKARRSSFSFLTMCSAPMTRGCPRSRRPFQGERASPAPTSCETCSRERSEPGWQKRLGRRDGRDRPGYRLRREPVDPSPRARHALRAPGDISRPHPRAVRDVRGVPPATDDAGRGELGRDGAVSWQVTPRAQGGDVPQPRDRAARGGDDSRPC